MTKEDISKKSIRHLEDALSFYIKKMYKLILDKTLIFYYAKYGVIVVMLYP